MNEYGEIIRNIRKKKNIKILELANNINISECHLSRMETGHRKVPFEVFKEALKSMGYDVERYTMISMKGEKKGNCIHE